MYYSLEEIKKMSNEDKFNKLLDGSDYDRGSIETLEASIELLRSTVLYLCEKLKLTDEERADLQMNFYPKRTKV